MNARTPDVRSRVLAVLVTFNPDVAHLRPTLSTIGAVIDVVVIDNSDEPSARSSVAALCNDEKATYQSLGGNAGIAAAQNAGIARARSRSFEYVLFLDDDSSMDGGAIPRLLEAADQARMDDPSVVGVGPRIVDARSKQTLAYAWIGNHIGLATMPEAGGPVDVAFLVSSGSLISLAAFDTYGPFRADYFIDQVDKEWGLRVGSSGGRMLVISDEILLHSLGDEARVTRGGKRVTFSHDSPVRHYYLTRNAIHMLRDTKLPFLRRLHLVRLLVDSSIRKVFSPTAPPERRRAVLKGWSDGIRGVRGPAPTGTES